MDKGVKIFRFDDISINTNIESLENIISYIRGNIPNHFIIIGFSPMVHNDCGERVFPPMFNALSDYKNFFLIDNIGTPEWINFPGISKENYASAGHGLIHINHKYLNKQAQEMSILVSCSLVKSKIFIPPFNQWNKDTEDVCNENGIELIKFEDGWKSMEHNEYDPNHNLWYLHAREWTLDKIKIWFGE